MAALPPLVSAIVPVLDGERTLAEAVESILGQAHPGLEVIVVDDGSTDGTAAVAARFGERIRYLRQENRGPAAARNAGIAMARGSAIAFLDADDLWPEGKLEAQVPPLADDPSVGVVMGRTRRVWGLGGDARPGDALVGPYLGSAVVRRSVFEAVGLFAESLRLSEDRDWFLRVREAGIPIVVLDRDTLLYRRHERSMSHGVPFADLCVLRVLKRSLDRRRRSGESA